MSYTGKFSKIEDNTFKDAVENSYYMVDILVKLGYSRTSGTMTRKIKERVIRQNLSLSHLIGNKATKHQKRGLHHTARYKLSDILVKDSTYTNIPRLKIRLVNAGVLQYCCSVCNNIGIWNGRPLTLQLHHLNGINNDHRIENLALLCPNCHTQTNNYGSKNETRK